MTTSEETNQEDMNEFQALSNEYQPEVEGPALSARKPSTALSAEYANADPQYVTKTESLARSHSSYRTVIGDGLCGWRAVIFSYFEGLWLLGDESKIAAEKKRFEALNTDMANTIPDSELLEMFVDATNELFDNLLQAVRESRSDEAWLIEQFDGYNAMALVTHFRALVRTRIEAHADDYQPYMEVPVTQYVLSTVMPIAAHIDEIGLRALVEGIIEPGKFAVEVVYLDRSEGDIANTHPISSIADPLYTIILLYRPGHYDILYRGEAAASVGALQGKQTLQVNCLYDMTMPTFTAQPMPPYMDIGLVPTTSNPMPTMLQYSQTYRRSSVPTYDDSNRDHSSHMDQLGVPVSPKQTDSTQSPSPMPPTPPDLPDSGLPIRPHPLTQEPLQTLPLNMSPSRNSYYNQAHFMNSDFQPLMWKLPHYKSS